MENHHGSSKEIEKPFAMSSAGAVNVRSHSCGLEAIAILALMWIDYDTQPRVIVTAGLEIMWTNDAARRALAGRRDIENRAGIFTAVNPRHQPLLLDLLAGAGATVTSWAFEREDGDGHLLLRAQRLEWRGHGLFGIAFFGSGTDFECRYENLEVVFGLTPSENRVLTALLSGYKTDQIAGMLGVGLATVRSHICAVYLKLNVNSREALFSRVRPFRL